MSEMDLIAERVRRFFNYQADFCDQLGAGALVLAGASEALRDELSLSHHVQSQVLACTAIAGLSYLWEELERPAYPFGGSDTERFICFLHSLQSNQHFGRVCTAFLYYALNKRTTVRTNGVERYFREELFSKWVRRENEYAQHNVNQDPQSQAVRDLYDECLRNNPALLDLETLRNPDHTFFTFTYAGLIYKYFRNAFAHQYYPSRHSASFGRPGEPMRVLQQSGYTVLTEVSPGNYVPTERNFVNELGDPITRPFLDVPITVLTEAIREGATIIRDLIIRERHLPYGYDEDIEVRTKS